MSLFRSLSAGHFAVALGIFGGLISQILIILSTGLLAPETKLMSFDTEFQMLDQFNLSSNAGRPQSQLVDTGLTMWAHAQDNAPYRPGATPEYASQSFSLPSDLSVPPGANLSANVSVFSVTQDCKAFSWTYPTRRNNKEFSLAGIMAPSDFDQLSPFCV